MNIYEEMDAELDVISIIYHILKHWRLLIVCMLLGGVLLNVYSYFKAKKDAAGIQQTIDDYNNKVSSGKYDEDGNTLMSIPEFEKSLTDRQINEVNNLISTYKMYQTPYSNIVEYIDHSLLMQIDAKAAPTYSIQYLVDTHYIVEYPVIEKQDYTNDILSSVSDNLLTNDLLEEISKELSNDDSKIDTTYIRELITVSSDNDILTIRFYGRTKDECEAIADIIKDKMPGIFTRLKKQYSDFDYSIISENYYENYDSWLLSTQQSKVDSLNNIYKTTQDMLKNLNDDQKNYFYALINNEETIFVVLPVDTTSSEEQIDPTTLTVPSIKKFNIKYIIIGLFAGLLVPCVIILAAIFIDGKLMYKDDIESVFYIPQLGSWKISAEPKGIFAFVDRWLIKLLVDRGDKKTPEESLDNISTDIILSAEKNNWTSLFLATTSRDSKTMDAISTLADKVHSKVDKISYGNTIYYDSKSLEVLTDSDAVVIIEQTDVSKMSEIRTEYNLCKRYKLPIIGYVTLK